MAKRCRRVRELDASGPDLHSAHRLFVGAETPNLSSTVPDYAGVPTAVFTVPELVRVGLLEDEATAAGIDVDVRYNDTSGWYSNYRIGETTAATKILVDTANDTIVGAHMLGPGYGELINVFSLAIKPRSTDHGRLGGSRLRCRLEQTGPGVGGVQGQPSAVAAISLPGPTHRR